MSKPPKPITAARLENIALAYLERFSASAASLRRVLLRRIARAADHMAGGQDDSEQREAAVRLVDELVDRYRRSGVLDDRRYAEGKVTSLHRHGASLGTIRRYLKERGVDGAVAEEAVNGLVADLGDGGDGNADLAAAARYARRRRIGPFRPQASREAHRQRDLAALGRAGFSWDVARAVIDGEGD